MKAVSLPVSTGTILALDMRLYAQGIYFIKVTGWGKPFVKKIFLAEK